VGPELMIVTRKLKPASIENARICRPGASRVDRVRVGGKKVRRQVGVAEPADQSGNSLAHGKPHSPRRRRAARDEIQ